MYFCLVLNITLLTKTTKRATFCLVFYLNITVSSVRTFFKDHDSPFPRLEPFKKPLKTKKYFFSEVNSCDCPEQIVLKFENKVLSVF